ncbi:MAG: SDR family NAD(P)-dependent oxidoreductase [Gammaproteobacteria bacterium]|nr:SDR family NAD(P)-dependent oxidoreductase [Gammaproteobacteria bacterium]MBU1555621.1 SDR family NAD(P)-dependent oxidoreductase [Gammaproteobacteria bacterium]MBU2069897.1 SDR family NAD(P)-dependent oxidoreductase [Gammaproteobacteria bacterium]MBU2184821.1 SDR family NAD(P)-dependent oxidoreductase [Gammaproteobacteria bacterium]MBU2204357.1 SDR family NAD(P)-dependent oxidoreductase [Gammaproteobacteria bacterium]
MTSTCLITGASSGIGHQLALHYAANGWTVYAVARSADKLAELSKNTGIHALPLDLTDNTAIQAAAASLLEQGVILDLVLLNAGTCEYVDVADLDLDAFQRTFAVNFHAVVAASKYFMPLLKASLTPQLAIVSSMAHFFPFTRAEAYGASKAAVSYFTDSLRVDLAGSGISVHLIEPGFVDTPLTQKNDFAMPFLVSVNQAAERIYNGLRRGNSRIRFPRRLGVMLKLLSLLPYNLRNTVALRMKQQ